MVKLSRRPMLGPPHLRRKCDSIKQLDRRTTPRSHPNPNDQDSDGGFAASALLRCSPARIHALTAGVRC